MTEAESAARELAEAVVEVLLERGLVVAAPPPHEVRVLNAGEVGRLLGRRRQWVYDHADELGGFRYGAGPRARLGFDRLQIERWMHEREIRRLMPNGRARPRQPRGRAPARGANLIAYEPLNEA